MSTGVFRGAALGVIVLGFVLGTVVAEPEHPLYMGLLWAVATAFGAVIGGAVFTLLVMGLVLNREVPCPQAKSSHRHWGYIPKTKYRLQEIYALARQVAPPRGKPSPSR